MLTLAISTSSRQFALALGENGTLLFKSSDFDLGEELDDMLRFGLDRLGRQVKDIGSIICDIGPGGTSRVRTGVAFANAISYTLDIPVYTLSSMELAGMQAQEKWGVPVLTSVKSIKGNAYIGLYDKQLLTLEFGAVDEVVPRLVANLDAFVAVGHHRDIIRSLPLEGKRIIDSGMAFGDVGYLIQNEAVLKQRPALKFPHLAQPIVENTL